MEKMIVLVPGTGEMEASPEAVQAARQFRPDIVPKGEISPRGDASRLVEFLENDEDEEKKKLGAELRRLLLEKGE